MNRRVADTLEGLLRDGTRTAKEDNAVARARLDALAEYRRAVANGRPTARQTERARRAFRQLGGDPVRSSASLKDYDHERYGPFLGISDEGSAAAAIRRAAFASPKCQALPKNAPRPPLVVGVAVDAERLGSIGEVSVGPDEFVDIWLECVDRVLITTNVGTRVNLRVYRREPMILLKGDSSKAIAEAKAAITAAFKPFVETPDGRPRPLTVFIDIPRYSRMTAARQRSALAVLVKFVASGEASGRRRAPAGQQLGLAAWVKLGPVGRDDAIAAINLAADTGMRVVILDGVKRKDADRAVSLAGLLDYFPPGLVGPILRTAAKKNIQVRAANLPDTDTIARSTWVGLVTARGHGASLGKYGCFPLTRLETDHVVQLVQNWLAEWSAAPVFFVDQGLLREDGVDVGRDLMRGLRVWLETVSAHGVRVVLIDTIDKASGKRLLRRSHDDEAGFLGPNQVRDIEEYARLLDIKVLWAGGLGLRDAFEMGRLAVFGIYVTSAAATTIPVEGSYTRDPSLAGLKEPTKQAVLRTKTLLEAGFLSARLGVSAAARLERLAKTVLAAHEAQDPVALDKHCETLASACVAGWRAHWRTAEISKP